MDNGKQFIYSLSIPFCDGKSHKTSVSLDGEGKK